MRRCRSSGLAGLAAVLLVAVGRAQVHQEPSAEATEGVGISINCSHPNRQSNEFVLWYRQFLGRGPELLVWGIKGSKALSDPPGWLSVAADGRSSALWLERPRRGDAAVYYCAVGDTGRGAGAAVGHEPPRGGPDGRGEGGGTVLVDPPGGAATPPARAASPRPTSQRFPRPTSTGFSINTGIDIDIGTSFTPSGTRQRGGISSGAVPVFGGAREGAVAAAVPGGSRRGAETFCSAEGGEQQRSSCPRAAAQPSLLRHQRPIAAAQRAGPGDLFQNPADSMHKQAIALTP
ncbi:uncharacterized protein LOC135576227 [Columba livia]|uniref:uncharacterized protein LOC135576227 n=1 Tax=Columba livia TaxID=8932 RepID=UPI0031BA1BF0